MRNPQSTTTTLVMNNAQLSAYIEGLQRLVDEGYDDKSYDQEDVMYVSPAQTLEQLKAIRANPEENAGYVIGLCL